MEHHARGGGLAMFGAGLAFLLSTTLLGAGRASAAGGSQVVATVGDHKITEQELDAKVEPQMAEVRAKIYEMKKDALEQMTEDYLLEQAAKQAGQTPDQYEKQEIIDKAGPVTDAEAKQFYEENKSRINAPYDQIKPRLMAYLNNQAQAQQRDKLLAELKAKTPVKILISAPRTRVASAGHPELGPADAPVTIVEFADFQCPFCGRSEPTIKALRSKYGDKIKLIYMDFPLPMHSNALDAAKAARCANEQGKFWPYHDELFANQTKLTPADLKSYAKQTGLDTAKFDDCFDKSKYESEVEKDMAEGRKLGVDGTPAFFIDGRLVSGAQPPEQFETVIDDELANKKTASAK
ncbi:MAG TPA: thioredoxin domain-containing protein [Candidatus Binataceae bacterium]|nr:thioredoxin domain-containing protein [Candidatus Binataceae bacterium]